MVTVIFILNSVLIFMVLSLISVFRSLDPLLSFSPFLFLSLFLSFSYFLISRSLERFTR